MRLKSQKLPRVFLVSPTIVKSKSVRGKGVCMCPYFPFCILMIVSLFNNSSINDLLCSQGTIRLHWAKPTCSVSLKIQISKHTYMGRHLDYSMSL